MPGKTYFQEKNLEHILTCKTCKHYFDNDCYFPKEEIDKIEHERLKRSIFLCKMCGNKIDRMLTVMQKLYFEKKYNMEIPLICCLCYENLNNDNFLVESKKWFYKFLYMTAGQIFFIFYFFLSFFIFGTGSFIFLVFCIPWSLTTIRFLKKLKRIRNGRNYYKKNFENKNQVKENV